MSSPAAPDPPAIAPAIAPADATAGTKAAAAAALAAVVGPDRPAQRRGAILQALAALLWIPQAALIAITLAALVEGRALPLPSAVLVGLYLAVAALRIGVDAWGKRIVHLAADRVRERLRARLVDALARWSPMDAGAPHSGAVAALAVDRVDHIEPYLTRYEPARLKVTVVPPVLWCVVMPLSWAAGIILLVAGPLIPVFMSLIGMKARQASQRQLAEIASMTGYLLDRIRGLVDIRLLDGTGGAAAALGGAADRVRRRTMAVLRIAFLSTAVLELFAALGVAMVAVHVGFELLGLTDFGTWGAPLGLAEGLLVLMLAPDFFQPLRDFGAAYHDRADAEAVALEAASLLGRQHASILGKGAGDVPSAGAPAIRLEDVSFAYAEGRPVLDGVDLEIRPGSRVAITGPSGAGKSTLLGLIAGFLGPGAGRIEAAGRPLDAASADGWRARIAWIGQRPHFVAGSLRANLALYGAAPAGEGLERALKVADAAGVVAAAPRGLATAIGETGHGVSGGEARRLALARAALAPGRDVVLADEPTAELDAETAAVVSDGLMDLAAGRTLIVATHDEALAARMDVRLAVVGGRLVATEASA
ncbi:MAG: thiol reductant ABC exporter subunit CydD [Rhodospirillaceae bacterium]|nr:thiol reductant ABC exporter subunit CydD [Rhodospirillaceae bacterium]